MNEQTDRKTRIDWITFSISGGFLVLFLLMSLLNKDLMGEWISSSFDFSVTFFGVFWQLLLLATFVVGRCTCLIEIWKSEIRKKRYTRKRLVPLGVDDSLYTACQWRSLLGSRRTDLSLFNNATAVC